MLTIKLVIPVTSVADPLSCTLPQAPVLEGAGHHFCEGELSYKQTSKQEQTLEGEQKKVHNFGVL